jgi:hypothetical protein
MVVSAAQLVENASTNKQPYLRAELKTDASIEDIGRR